MKLLLYNFETKEICLEDKVTVLEIENPKIFNGILFDIFNGCFPYQEIAFSDENTILTSKDIFCIIDLYNFNLCEKSFISKLYKYLDKYISENILLRMKFDEAFSDFANAVNGLISDIDIDFDYSQINDVKNALSLINLTINVEQNNMIEKLMLFIKVCSELKLYKVLILVNAKAYLISEELSLLYKQSFYYNIPLVLLESRHNEILLENEQKVFADENFCDIIIV